MLPWTLWSPKFQVSSLSSCLLPGLAEFLSTHAAWCLAKDSRAPCADLWSSLSAPLPPFGYSSLQVLTLAAPNSATSKQGDCCALLGFQIPVPWSKSASSQRSGDCHGFMCFPSHRDCSLLLPVVHHLKPLLHIYLPSLIAVYVRRASQVPVVMTGRSVDILLSKIAWSHQKLIMISF